MERDRQRKEKEMSICPTAPKLLYESQKQNRTLLSKTSC